MVVMCSRWNYRICFGLGWQQRRRVGEEGHQLVSSVQGSGRHRHVLVHRSRYHRPRVRAHLLHRPHCCPPPQKCLRPVILDSSSFRPHHHMGQRVLRLHQGSPYLLLLVFMFPLLGLSPVEETQFGRRNWVVQEENLQARP